MRSAGMEATELAWSIAHELGHGAFQLQHVWKEQGYTTDTRNLMGYSKTGELFRWQWQDIHHPVSHSNLLADEEDLGAKILTLNHPKKPKNAYLKLECNITTGPNIKYGTTIAGYGFLGRFGVDFELFSIEFVGNFEEAYLNIEIINKNPRLIIDGNYMAVGAKYTMTYKVNPFSSTPVDCRVRDNELTLKLSGGNVIIDLNKKGKETIGAYSLFDFSTTILAPIPLQMSFSISVENLNLQDGWASTISGLESSYNQRNVWLLTKQNESNQLAKRLLKQDIVKARLNYLELLKKKQNGDRM